jgi:hypothetical protein
MSQIIPSGASIPWKDDPKAPMGVTLQKKEKPFSVIYNFLLPWHAKSKIV